MRDAKAAEDARAVDLLRWALPQLGLRFEGFRNVRGQVDKRVHRRAQELGLAGLAEYRAFIEAHPAELDVLARACRVTISRLYRDRAVFDALRAEVLPRLAEAARARGERALRVWSAGCASGEEPSTVAIAWHLELAPRFPGLALSLVATDVDDEVLDRARRACYAPSSLRDVPAAWRERAFVPQGSLFCVREELRAGVELRRQDLRDDAPDGPFDLVLCRNLAFTYFAEPLQRIVAARIAERLVRGGVLVVGAHEALPEGEIGLARLPALPPELYARA
jgi:chemotaxis protein methyltransferase CheR